MGPRPLEPGVGEAPTGRIQNGGRRADPKRRPPFGSETGAAEEAPQRGGPKTGAIIGAGTGAANEIPRQLGNIHCGV